MYSKAHAAIRADPTQKAKAEKTVEKKRWNRARLSAAQRNLFQLSYYCCIWLFDNILFILILCAKVRLYRPLAENSHKNQNALLFC